MNWCSLLLVCCCMIWLYHQIKFNRSYYLVMLLPFNHVLQAFFFCFTVLDSARKFRTMWACTKILVFFALLCMINQYGWMQHFFSIAEIGRKTTWKNGRWIVKSFLFYEIIVVVSIWFRLRLFSVVVSSSFVIT